MRLQIKQKFPCGYEVEMEATAWNINVPTNIALGKCPMHGVSCPKKSKQSD